jgi:ubiquitin C-terminal hydrolase
MKLNKMTDNYTFNNNTNNNSIINYQNNNEKQNPINGICGLANEHAWCCYMNSILQCLSNLKIFRNYIINIDDWFSKFSNVFNNNDNNIPDDPTIILNKSKLLCFQTYRLFDIIWKTSDETYDPRSFQNLFLEKISYFNKGVQQDSQETLIKFLEIFHNELSTDIKNFDIKNKSNNFDIINSLIEDKSIFPNIITNEINYYINNYNYDFTNVIIYRCIKNHYSINKYSLLSDIFGGFQANELICPITNKKRILVESFYMLTIPIPTDNDPDSESESESESESDSNETKHNPFTSKNKINHKCINNTTYTLNLDTSQLSNSDNDLDGDLFIEDKSDTEDDTDMYDSNNHYEFYNSPYYNNINNNSLFNKNDNITMNFNNNNKLYNNNMIKKVLKSFTLDECFELFTKPEILDDDNKWNSPFSNTMVNAVKTTSIWEPPKILIIGLKRNEIKITYSGNTPNYTNSKKSNKISFEINNFNIKKYIHPLKKNSYDNNQYIYNLQAINNHSGNVENGHYWSYCKNSIDNKWYNFNDDNVTPINEKNLITKNAYILFYLRSDIN